MRAVVLYPGEDGYWVAECPSLPGCISQGNAKPEALANIKEAIEGWLETAEAHGQPIPKNTSKSKSSTWGPAHKPVGEDSRQTRSGRISYKVG